MNADDTAYLGITKTALSCNAFAYCENNPVTGIDPTGHYNISKFNCYAYAFGISNKWLHPGNGVVDVLSNKNNKSYPKYYSVTQVRKWVIDDFGKNKVRILKNKNSPLKKGEYRIAIRVCYTTVRVSAPFYGENGQLYYQYLYTMKITIDFHFWKQNPKTGVWWHKPGEGKIKKLGKINPNNSKKWGIYNSKTLYVAYKGDFWTK